MKRYPGVSPFNSEQSSIFFGRDDDIDQLQKLIGLRKQVLLYSKSGIGKTSLLNAGVLPILEEKFNIIKIRFFAYLKDKSQSPVNSIIDMIRSGKDYPGDMRKTILDELIPDDIYFEKSLWYFLKKIQLTTPSRFILVFDQFEELFTFPKEDIEAFKNQLNELLYIDVPDLWMQLLAKHPEMENEKNIDGFYERLDVKIVFAIRSDRLFQLNDLSDKLPDIQKTFYELKPLDAEQAGNAILKPAEAENERFETKPFMYHNEAVETILQALTGKGSQSIETTQLQIVCQRIETIVSQKQLDSNTETMITIGKSDLPEFKNIFLTFFEESVNQTTEPEKARKFIEDQLIRKNQRISLDALICESYLKPETLQLLVNKHLLRAERNSTGGYNFELSHDTLVEPVVQAANKRRQKEEEERQIKIKNEELENALKLADQHRKEQETELKRQEEILKLQREKTGEAEKARKMAEENFHNQRLAAHKQRKYLIAIIIFAGFSLVLAATNFIFWRKTFVEKNNAERLKTEAEFQRNEAVRHRREADSLLRQITVINFNRYFEKAQDFAINRKYDEALDQLRQAEAVANDRDREKVQNLKSEIFSITRNMPKFNELMAKARNLEQTEALWLEAINIYEDALMLNYNNVMVQERIDFRREKIRERLKEYRMLTEQNFETGNKQQIYREWIVPALKICSPGENKEFFSFFTQKERECGFGRDMLKQVRIR